MTGTAYGTLDDPRLTYNGYVNLRAGVNKISLLSVAVGLPVGCYLNFHLILETISVLSCEISG